LAHNVAKKLDVGLNDYNFANFTLILLPDYLVKCISRSLAVYNNEFILGSTCVGSKKITKTTKSGKMCYLQVFNINHIHL